MMAKHAAQILLVILAVVTLGGALDCWHCSSYQPATVTAPANATKLEYSTKCGKNPTFDADTDTDLIGTNCTRCKKSKIKVKVLFQKEFTYYTRDCENTTTPITGEINVNFGLGTAKGVAYNCMGDLCNSATMRQIPAFVPLIIALLTLVSPNVLS